jgi:uncharacterized protein YecT (DUF1311 family)
MLWVKYFLVVAAAVGCLLGSVPVRADCGAAKTELDRMICGTPEIAAKDRLLNQKYQAAMAMLSSAGQKYLRQAQRRWLALVRTDCGQRLSLPADETNGPITCLNLDYDARLRQLDLAAKQVGPYVIGRIEEIDFQSTQVGDQSGLRVGIAYRQVARPYIDQPVSAATQRWNEMVEQLAQRGEADVIAAFPNPPLVAKAGTFTPRVDMDIDYKIGLGSGDFIAVQFKIVLNFQHKPREPDGRQKTVTSNYLMQERREATFDELFQMGPAQQKIAATACRFAIQRANVTHTADARGCDAGRWAAWFPSGRGLVVMVPTQWPVKEVADDIGITLPWSELAPVLAPSLPFTVPD